MKFLKALAYIAAQPMFFVATITMIPGILAIMPGAALMWLADGIEKWSDRGAK